MGKLSLFRKKSTASLRDEAIDADDKAETTPPPALPPLSIGGIGAANASTLEHTSSLVSPPRSPLELEAPQTSLLDEIFSDLSLSTGLGATTVHDGPAASSSSSSNTKAAALPNKSLLDADTTTILDTADSARKAAKAPADPDREFINIYRKAAAHASKTPSSTATTSAKAKHADAPIRSSVTTVYTAGAKPSKKSHKADKRASWRKQSENAARARAATFAAGRFADEARAYGDQDDDDEEEDEETTSSSDYSSTSSESDASDAEHSDAESDASVSSGGAGLNRIGQIAVAHGLARQAEREKASRIQHWAGTVEKADNGNLAIERMKDRHRQEMEAVAGVAPLAAATANANNTAVAVAATATATVVNTAAAAPVAAVRAGMTRHMTTGAITASTEYLRNHHGVAGAGPHPPQPGMVDHQGGFVRKHSMPVMNGSHPNPMGVANIAAAHPNPAAMMGPNGATPMPFAQMASMPGEVAHRGVPSSTSTVSTGAAPSSAASSASSNTGPDTSYTSDRANRKMPSKARLQQIPSSDEEDEDDEASDDETPIAPSSRPAAAAKKPVTVEAPRPVMTGPTPMHQRGPTVPRSPLYQQQQLPQQQQQQQTYVAEHHSQMPAMGMMMPAGMPQHSVPMAAAEPSYVAGPPMTLIQQQQQMAAAAQQAKLQQQQHHATSSSQMWTPGRTNPAAASSAPLNGMAPMVYPSPRPDTPGARTPQPAAGYVRPGQPTLLQQQQMMQQQQQQQQQMQMHDQYSARMAGRQAPPLSPPHSARNSVGFPAPQRSPAYAQQSPASMAAQPQSTAGRVQPLISGFSQSPLSGQ
ncbi:hypothetical protein SYNPS1DRAFT_23792 [Syncephalis pseudoplumigaleata]|uniref:Uncharacterized protein n=1 Tax=Syncephalis pseudoplumigaleata TaxID=1712513 RepID=A0A4P9YVL8_9FUNG|nr:hypothetical protein SYNPS1DRAFT_23792 [Syncephalis pseudoplumigaleata]|eukprot:RKP24113.1 hypothetical protein SYNPS1DRAFT_23792 [Syncephalis pseudoplumigaleata]